MSIAPFDDLVERLALSSRDWDRIRKVRASLSDLLSEAFHNVPGFCGVTYIGSTESGCALKWGYDIDCVIGLTPFTRSAFVDGLSSLDHHFDGLRFRDASHIVPAIATTYFRGEKLGIVGVDPSRMDTCEGDVWQHGAFTRRHLRRQLHRDVLLAKAFFRALNIPKKAVGCGFAVEQMIAHCGGFIELLRVFAAGEPMVIDYSGKYSGRMSALVITYPYSGLENLSEQFSESHLRQVRDYAREVLREPQRLLEDALTCFNQYLWTERVKALGGTEAFSSPDIYLTRRENRAIRRIVRRLEVQHLLDLGCADGLSTAAILAGMRVHGIGIDRNDEAIRAAQHVATDTLRFAVADMACLPFADESFDFVLLKRALGNVPSRARQQQVLNESVRVLKHAGHLCVCDATADRYEQVNKYRGRLQVPPLRHPNHTLLLSEDALLRMTTPGLSLRSRADDVSTYYVITRVVFPAIVQWCGGRADDLPHASALHRVAARLPSVGEAGLQLIYLFQK